MTDTITPFPGYYMTISGQLIRQPKRFFEQFRDSDASPRQAGTFLILSGLLFVAATILVLRPARPVPVASILFANAVGMALFSGLAGYIVMGMTLGRRVSLARLLTVYAFAFGVTLLFAWIPYSVWLIEPWKWWLVFTGLTLGCGFRTWEALLVMVLSVAVIIGFFYSLMAVL